MLQELNVAVHGHKPEWMQKFDEEVRKAKIHVEFCCSLYREQLRQGRHFLHEHPWSARSWGLPCVQEILNHPSVEIVQGHMCRFRMTTHITTKNGQRGRVKKPTGFLSSSRCVRQDLDKKCTVLPQETGKTTTLYHPVKVRAKVLRQSPMQFG